MGKISKGFLSCAALFGGTAILANPAHATDVQGVNITKIAGYQETDFSAPALSGYEFNAYVSGTGNTTTGVMLSGAATATFTNTPSGDTFFSGPYPSLAAFDSAFPDAGYTITIDTVHDGVRTVSADFSGGSCGPIFQVDNATVNPSFIQIQAEPITLPANESLILQVIPVGSPRTVLAGADFTGASATPPQFYLDANPGDNFETAGLLLFEAVVQNTTGGSAGSDYPTQVSFETETDVFLPTPAPEPASLAILSFGLLPFLHRPKHITR